MSLLAPIGRFQSAQLRCAVAAAVTLMFSAACTAPDYESCAISCGPQGNCPGEMSCSRGFCTSGQVCHGASGGAPSTGGTQAVTGGASGSGESGGKPGTGTGGDRLDAGGHNPASSGGSDSGAGPSGNQDAQTDASSSPAKCSTSTPFGDWVALEIPGLESRPIGAIHFSRDNREAYFGSTEELWSIYTATYNEQTSTFGRLQVLLDDEGRPLQGTDPALTPDGLSLYYTKQPGDTASNDLWVARRESRDDPFHGGAPVRIEGVNTSSLEGDAFITADGSTLYFDTTRHGDHEIYSVPLDQLGVAPSPASTNWPDVDDYSPVLTDDNLTIYFGSGRDPENRIDIYMATRTTERDGFGRAIKIFSSEATEYPQAISADGCTLWFESSSGTSTQLYYARRPLR